MVDEENGWIMVKCSKPIENCLNDYYVCDEGCGCCTSYKSSPSLADLKELETHLNDQLKTVCFLMKKYYGG